jgi:hypothetical protein
MASSISSLQASKVFYALKTNEKFELQKLTKGIVGISIAGDIQ